eukprot:UN24488
MISFYSHYFNFSNTLSYNPVFSQDKKYQNRAFKFKTIRFDKIKFLSLNKISHLNVPLMMSTPQFFSKC